MNDKIDTPCRQQTGEADGTDSRSRLYYYKDAGIQEHHGYIPLWLWSVAVSLLIWGIYYLVVYWSPPSG